MTDVEHETGLKISGSNLILIQFYGILYEYIKINIKNKNKKPVPK